MPSWIVLLSLLATGARAAQGGLDRFRLQKLMGEPTEGDVTNVRVTRFTNEKAVTNVGGRARAEREIELRTNIEVVPRKEGVIRGIQQLLEKMEPTDDNALELIGAVSYLLRLEGESKDLEDRDARLRYLRGKAALRTGDTDLALEDLEHVLAGSTGLTNVALEEIYLRLSEAHGVSASRAYAGWRQGRNEEAMDGEGWYSNYAVVAEEEQASVALLGFYKRLGSERRKAEKHRQMALLYAGLAHAHPYREGVAEYNRGCREYGRFRETGDREALDRAREAFEKAREGNPGLLGAWVNGGIVMWLLGDREAAAALWREAAAKDPEDPEPERYLARYEWEAGRIDEARRHLRLHALLAGEDPETYILLARSYLVEPPVREAERDRALRALRIASYWLAVRREPIAERSATEEGKLRKLLEGLSPDRAKERGIVVELRTNAGGGVATNVELSGEDRVEARERTRAREALRRLDETGAECRRLEAETYLRHAEYLRSQEKTRDARRFFEKAVERDPSLEGHRKTFEE